MTGLDKDYFPGNFVKIALCSPKIIEFEAFPAKWIWTEKRNGLVIVLFCKVLNTWHDQTCWTDVLDQSPCPTADIG